MRFRAYLTLLLVVHLLVHPMAHGLPSCGLVDHADSVSIRPLCTSAGNSVLDNCSLCQTGSNTLVTPSVAIQILNPHWIRVRTEDVFCASFCIDPGVPARAPPFA
jgi:hypothetical protein